jgi:hypothetical protein
VAGYFYIKDPGIWGYSAWEEISPYWAPFLFLICQTLPANPDLPSFSVRVDNTVKYGSVCQNTADLHLAYGSLMPLKSIWILPCSLLQTEPVTLPECECEALFFLRRRSKKRDSKVTDYTSSVKQVAMMIYSKINTGSVFQTGDPVFRVQWKFIKTCGKYR